MPSSTTGLTVPDVRHERVPDHAPASGAAGAGALILLAIVLVALNLRAAVTSLGALLDEVSAGLHLSAAMAGVVTMMPALSFAAFGALTPRVAARLGDRTLFLLAMALLAAGQVARALTDSTAIFLITSALALSGIAMANVLLPAYVRRAFPQRAGLVTGVYTMTLTVGACVAAGAAVPVADAFGSWRMGLGVWALLAAVAVLPWMLAPASPAPKTQPRPDQPRPDQPRPAQVQVARTRLGWLMALYFGTQALNGYAVMGWLAQLYRDAGFTPQTAGLLLAAVTAAGVPIALLLPTLAARLTDQRPLILLLGAATLVAYVGLALAPHGGALAWSVLLALGQSAFPLILMLIGMRARTAAGTVALSAFTQSWGYLLAALGPFAVGVLYGLTGGWNAPLGVLAAVAVVQTLAGLRVARPRFIEDELAP